MQIKSVINLINMEKKKTKPLKIKTRTIPEGNLAVLSEDFATWRASLLHGLTNILNLFAVSPKTMMF